MLDGCVQAMRHILLYAIRLYWQVWPESRRRCCLFRETCSRHVYRVTVESGFSAGLRALFRRFRACRSGYSVTTVVTGVRICLADGTTITQEEASPSLLSPYRIAAERLQQRWSQT